MANDRAAGDEKTARRGRLVARPAPTAAGEAAVGLQTFKVEGASDALVYVPASYRRDAPAALALMLHGAGGAAEHGLSLLRGFADESNLILAAPQSAAGTWDAIRGGFGLDVAAIDRLLAQIFTRYPVDAKRVAVGGFSDGASYALGLGLLNGALFTHVIAFSPGFVAGVRELEGTRPRLFVSHGTRDRVLPVEHCSRPIVERVRGAGYIVRYREFDGPHTVPAEIAREAAEWFLKK